MRVRRTATLAVSSAAALASLALAGPALAAGSHPAHHASPFRVRVILNGASLKHTFIPSGSGPAKTEALSSPDDITMLGGHLFAGFQNGVGPQGQPSADGNTDSTVVEFTASGKVIRKWSIKGKCDGLTANAGRGFVIATVNEDANSSIYTITPGASAGRRVRHYNYSEPLPHFGGTDAISIYRGRVFISASAPGTTGAAAPQPSYPAVYSVVFHRIAHVAAVTPLYSDEADATVANLGADHGKTVQLALTDPDSNEVVPGFARRFAGDFMVTSQGDQEQIFAHFRGRGANAHNIRLSVLRLSQAVDDTAWARARSGRIFGADGTADTVDVVTGHFRPGSIFVAVTPCDAADAPATCPGPGFPANYLGSLNPWTGNITRVAMTGPSFEPKGLVFVGRDWRVMPG
jgi:hypothetical protein